MDKDLDGFGISCPPSKSPLPKAHLEDMDYPQIESLKIFVGIIGLSLSITLMP